MKVLLFTDEHDIDGMGSVIVGKTAFKDFNFITCKRLEINLRVEEAMNSGQIYEYDLIFMADICAREPLLAKINDDQKLKDKFLIFDHHKTELAANKYSFVNVVVENELGLVSGTSLFYDYLVSQNYLTPSAGIIELVELTRQYDTWEWTTKYHNAKPRMLHILFEELGYQEYLNLLQELVENPLGIIFSKHELSIINHFESKLEDAITDILSKLIIKELIVDDQSYKVGIVNTPYHYRNDLPEDIRNKKNIDIDVLAMIITDGDTVSYRNIKDVDVSKIASYFGGNGHRAAGASPQKNTLFIDFINKAW